MENLFVLTLSLIPKVGRKTIQKVYQRYKGIEIDENIYKEVIESFIIGNKHATNSTLDSINIYREKAEQIMKDSKSSNIELISIFNEDYPERLKNIEDPPVLLYVKGNKTCLYENNSVAIIGTREPTLHGGRIAQRLGEIAAIRNSVVVSGLALGCDSFAHLGCVKNAGRGIAVLPGGLDKVYPASNKTLADSILKENGCLVSEYPIGTKPFRNYYVERDRIQSALSAAVIVVETDVKGGTMHTVRFALAQKKILSCYQHDAKYHEYKQTKGNVKLIEDGVALPLKNETDINNLFNLINEQTEAHNLNKGNNLESHGGEGVQLTISDIGGMRWG